LRASVEGGPTAKVGREAKAEGRGHGLNETVGNIQQPTTNIQQPTTNNQQPTTNNQQPTTNNQQPTSNIQPRTSNLEPPMTGGRRLMAAGTSQLEDHRGAETSRTT
jgi:hypothetical protein